MLLKTIMNNNINLLFKIIMCIVLQMIPISINCCGDQYTLVDYIYGHYLVMNGIFPFEFTLQLYSLSLCSSCQ